MDDVKRRSAVGRWWARPASTRSFLLVMGGGAIASVVVLVMGARPLFESARLREAAVAEADRLDRANGAPARTGHTPVTGQRNGGAAVPNRVAASVVIRVAPADDPAGQRTIATDAPEALGPGERIRVGVRPGGYRFLFAVSVDERGTVTPLYPDVGTSMPLPRGGALQYLPDALELTGAGRERLVVLLTEQPLELDTIRRAAITALRQVGGDLTRFPHLALEGEQFHRMFTHAGNVPPQSP